jgi:hypothetical protein
LASIYRNPCAEKKLHSAGAESLRSHRAPCISPGPGVLGHAHGVDAAAGTSDHVEEGFTYVLRKKSCMRYGRAKLAISRRVKLARKTTEL